VFGDAEEVGTSSGVLVREQHVELPEERRVNHKEIRRQDPFQPGT
jgi:hypothetical protein